MSSILWLVIFVALMIWRRFGAAGLESAATFGAFFVGGLGVRSFLDLFGSSTEAEKRKATAAVGSYVPRENRYKHGLFRAKPQDMRQRTNNVPPKLRFPCP